MAKLFSLSHILMPEGVEVPRRTVFDATPTQAKQFDRLGAARPATAAEIKAADAQADGTAELSGN